MINTTGWTILDVSDQITSNQCYLKLKPARYADPEEKASFEEAEEELHDLAVKFEQMGGIEQWTRYVCELTVQEEALKRNSMAEDANAYFE
jgi:hypothetical protein